MKINFYTHLLDTYEKFPDDLPVVPRVGELVESESGIVLKVVGVLYSLKGIKVELHLSDAWKGKSIRDFEVWYENRKRGS